jgi:hypothetical protein
LLEQLEGAWLREPEQFVRTLDEEQRRLLRRALNVLIEPPLI